MTDHEQICRRRFVAIATANFDPDLFPDLPAVANEVGQIAAWLTDERLGDRQFTQDYPELATDPVFEKIEAHFRNPSGDELWNKRDAAVLYITGHGAIDESRIPHRHLIVLNGNGRELASTALPTELLLDWLRRTGIEHLLVIIDVCFAGQVAQELTAWAKGIKDYWLILPSAQADQQAEPLALTRAISEYVEIAAEYNTNDKYLPVGLFVNAVNGLLPEEQQIVKIYKGPHPKKSGDRDRHVCLPNPAYNPRDELVRIDPARQELALPRRFLDLHNRVNGEMPSADNPGWLFTGRAQLMRDLVSAAGTPGVTMITGGSGSGKSTALSRLVTLSDPGFRREYEPELTGVPADDIPIVHVALSARRMPTRHVVTQICHDLLDEVPRVSSLDDPVRANRKALSRFLALSKEPVTIVIDALDEAEDAIGLVTSVLEPLRREHPDKLCLLVGVRSPGGDNPTAAGSGEPRQEPLRDLMAAVLGARQIQADDDLRWNPDDLTTFVRNILTNTESSPYRNASRATVAEVTDLISGLAGRSYLMARAAALTVTDNAEVIAPDDPALLGALKGGLLGVFRRDLQVGLRSPAEWRQGVALLRALAFARGTGLPRRQVWPKVATAVDAGDDAGSDYGDAEIRGLLQSRLSGYLMTDQQDDLTVYRLIHDELRDILLYQWRELLKPAPRLGAAGASPETGGEPPSREDESDIRAVEARIADVLRPLAKVRPTVTANQLVSPYVRRHFAEHALDGGVLEESVPPSFLPYLDLARLRAAVGASPVRRQVEEGVRWLPVIRQVTHLWDWNRPARNAAAIAMWVELNEPGLLGRRAEEPGPVGGPWQVDWAVRPPDLSNVLGYHREIVRAAATAELSGEAIAVTGGEDGLLHIWDLSTGAPYRDREPIETNAEEDERKRAIVSVATARLPDGRTVAATGGADGNVRIWDLGSGRTVGELSVIGTKVMTVMTATLADQRVVVSAADEEGTVRTWDLPGCEPVGDPLRCGPGLALGLAAASVGGQVLGLATGEDSGLQLWDLASGLPAGERLSRHPLAAEPGTGTVQGGSVIASAVLAGREVAIIGSGDGMLLWDLRERQAIVARLNGRDGQIRSLAVAQQDDRITAVTGGSTTVQVWDLVTREPIGALLPGHGGTVDAVAVAETADGSVLAVSASQDKSVRFWDVPGAALSRRSPAPRIGIVEAVAIARSPDGRAVACTCSGTEVQVWDLGAGQEPVPLTEYDSPVVSVTTAELPEGLLAVAGHWDGTISAWWTDGGRPVSCAKIGDLGAAAALATATSRAGLPVVLAGGWDGNIRLWDPLTGAPAGEPLSGHTDVVVAVRTATSDDGRTLVISGAKDGHVRVHDLSAHLDPRRPVPGPPVDADTGEEVASLNVAVLAGGQPCIVVGGEDGVVRVLDLVGAQIGEWPACSGAVTAVAAGQLPDGRVVVFTGGEDSLVQAWDASTGHATGEALPVPGPVRALAFQTELPSLVVGGTGVAVARLRQPADRGHRR